MQLPGHNKGPFQSLIMNLKRESLPKKWEVLDQEEDLLEEGVAPVIEACEPQSGALEASDDNGAQKSHLKTAIEPKDSERPSGLAPASQRQHTSSPLEPQKTQEACYLTDDDDKTRAEDAIDADRTFETIDQRSGGIDVSSYQSVAHKPQKRASASLPSNKRPAKLIKVEFKMPVQGGPTDKAIDSCYNPKSVKEDPDLPDMQRENGRSLGGSGEGSNDPSGSQQPAPSPESKHDNDDESTDVDSFVGGALGSGDFQEKHFQGDGHHQNQPFRSNDGKIAVGSKLVKRKNMVLGSHPGPELAQAKMSQAKLGISGFNNGRPRWPSDAAVQDILDERAASAARQATSEFRELPIPQSAPKQDREKSAQASALEELRRSRTYLSKFRDHYDRAHQHFVRQVNEIIQMTSFLEFQSMKNPGHRGGRSQIDMAPISRACAAAMGIVNSYAAPLAPPHWLAQPYLHGPYTNHVMVPPPPMPFPQFVPRYMTMAPWSAPVFHPAGGQSGEVPPLQGFNFNAVDPPKGPVPDVALKRQMKNGNSQFLSQPLVPMVPVDGQGQYGVPVPANLIV